MNKKQTTTGRRWMSVFGLAFGLATSCLAYEGIINPLYIGNMNPVLDERGNPMHGSNRPEEAADRSRVELRLVSDGIIHPPSVNGEAHSNNPLVSPDCVGGMGQNSGSPHTGYFCMVFPYRLPPGLNFFIRVYNAPSAGEASFYVDSPVMTVPHQGSSLFFEEFAEPMPIDTRDIDADGLVNSWEKALGTDSLFSSDFDGDGLSDLDEFRAGTEANDATSSMAFQSIRRELAPVVRSGDGSAPKYRARLSFASVPGKSYQVECVPSLEGVQETRLVSDVVTAGEDETVLEVAVEVPEDSVVCAFRLRLITE